MRKISMFIVEILQLLRERYRISTVEYSHSELYGLFVVTGTALSVISCISFVDSSPNLLFSHPFNLFVDETWLPTKKLTFAALISI